MLTVFTRGSVWQNAWNFSEGKTGGGRVDVRGVRWFGANSCGISYNRASQRGASWRIECDTISNTHKDVSTRVTQQQTNICSLYFISTMPLD